MSPPAPVARLRAEVDELRARIARLEGKPEQPETQATLEHLRADLAGKEDELARAQADPEGAPDPLVDPEAATGTETGDTARPDRKAGETSSADAMLEDERRDRTGFRSGPGI